MFTAHTYKRVDVLPDNLLSRCDLKDSTGSALTDKGVAVGQSLCATNVIAEKRYWRAAFIFPGNLVIAWIDLNNPRVAHALPVRPIVE